MIILGIVKVGAGLAFGESLAGLLQRFPKSLLGIMVCWEPGITRCIRSPY